MASTGKGIGSMRSLLLLGILSVFVSGLVVFLLWGYGPAYQVLYSNLSGSDSGAVIDRLRDLGVPYKVEGSTISVPSERVYETRMELAGEGLPQGEGIGYEIFDTTSFGVTQFVQRINYKRALQGELSRTISQLNEVDSARVHLSIPDSGSFFGEDRKSSASVVVKLRPGRSLTQGQVASIIHLISNSTENLSTGDVTVVDTEGRMWTRSNKDGGDAYSIGATQVEYRVGLEKGLERRIESMLEKTVGVNRVVARVSIDVETRHVEKTEEVFDPEGVVPRSEQTSKESTTGGVSGASGVPGVLSNLPGGAQQGAGVGRSASPAQSKTDTETINYEISKTVSHTIEPVSNIKRLTASILVDGTYNTVTDADGNSTRTYVARTGAEIASYVKMVEGAIGFSKERGDEIAVVSTPFVSELQAGQAPVEEAAPLIPMALVPVLVKYASVFLVALISILFVLRPLVKRLLSTVPEGAGAALVGAEGVSAPALEAGAEATVQAVQSEESKTLNALKDSVKINPEQAAMVIKGMVKER